MAGQLSAGLGGGGSVEVQEPGPTEEGEEPPPGSEAFKAEADAERFDTTFLARADDWRIAEPTPAPTGFPLQAIPRLAYVINYNVVFDEDAGEWVPQNPFEGAGGGTSYSFRLIERTTDTSDIDAAVGDWVTVENTTGSTITVNLPSGASESDIVGIANRNASTDNLSISPAAGDTAQDAGGGGTLLPQDSAQNWYDPNATTWWQLFNI